MHSAHKAFPNDPIFTRLRRFSVERPGEVFHDEYGVNASYNNLISDITHLRQVLREKLPNGLSGYSFIISFLAIAALGGICVPLATTGLLPDEALYYLNKCNAACVLAETSPFDKAAEIRDYARVQADQQLKIISVTRAYRGSDTYSMQIDDELTFSPTTGCLVLFTSGTTGQPKGALLPRRFFYYKEYTICSPADLYLSSTAIHWISGAEGLLYSVLNGERLWIMKSQAEPMRFWEILAEGKVTRMSVSPTLLRALMDYYKENIQVLPHHYSIRYTKGAQGLQTIWTGGSVLSPITRRFFTDQMNIPIRNGYGSTEMGGAVMATPSSSDFVDGSIGGAFPGVTIKLSDGDHGEILVKNPNKFIQYVNDEAATRAAFDCEGFYKTGDYAHRVGDHYFFDGRASCDWVRFHEYTISVLELERCLMDLPYVSEAHVLPVLDHQAGGLAAALLRLQKQKATQEVHHVNLRSVRKDLAATNMVSYKIPTLLRILKNEEQVPLSASGKVLKKECLRRYFNIPGYLPDRYAVDGVEYWGNRLDLAVSTRLFDWGGI
ncbi:class I adenylate-forming enzyme family protein [Aspergillus alliaceus]|uniref:class I adenylate-forming enzyme family protein n=1 Tax=Petromyces alliaceus TaxID=209559 RepID=UPI0012A4FAC1|nr:uncharacterized protein BDW43DRAFT_310715 [Aspergillus alliaceus]KAB8234044.1 hypothetical protein BDW43DRAFT_310715 [Aspergillus alliaceus]